MSYSQKRYPHRDRHGGEQRGKDGYFRGAAAVEADAFCQDEEGHRGRRRGDEYGDVFQRGVDTRGVQAAIEYRWMDEEPHQYFAPAGCEGLFRAADLYRRPQSEKSHAGRRVSNHLQ